MEIRFNVTGGDRKKLVGAISEELNAPMKYLGAPTFAYEVGGYSIDKVGTLTWNEGSGEELNKVFDGLEQRGYAFDRPALTEQPKPKKRGLLDIIVEELNENAEDGDHWERLHHAPTIIDDRGREHNLDGSFAAKAADNKPDTLTIELPLEGFTETSLDNLEKLVISKAALIKKAVGASELPIERTENTLRFPWFSADIPEAINAYTQFIAALAAMAKEQKRITAKEKPVDNEKYAFRCFLLRLGFIGEEYAAARKILLAGLSGNSSFKSGERKAPDTAAPAADNGEEVVVADTDASEETSADSADTGENVVAND